jgi:rhodanese-related sulfurtransferase
MNPARSIVVAVSRPQWQPPVRNGKTLADRLAELPDGAEIVAYCRGRYCLMSVEAVRLLRARGYNVRPLDGGMIE